MIQILCIFACIGYNVWKSLINFDILFVIITFKVKATIECHIVIVLVLTTASFILVGSFCPNMQFQSEQLWNLIKSIRISQMAFLIAL